MASSPASYPAAEGIFSKLPPELFACLAFFMPTSAAAAFSMCSKSLRYKMGGGDNYFEEINKGAILQPVPTAVNSEHWAQLNDREQEHENFLILLDRDFAHLIYCHYCKRLHTLKSHEIDSKVREEDRECNKVVMHGAISSYLHYSFSFVKVQILMKLYRAGKDYRQALREVTLPWGELHDERIKSRWVTVWTMRSSSKARVFDGRLLIRCCHRISIKADPPPSGWLTPDKAKKGLRTPNKIALKKLDISLCPHLKRWPGPHRFVAEKPAHVHYDGDFLVQSEFEALVMDKLSNPGSSQLCDRRRACSSCATEFVIRCRAVREAGEDRLELVFTVWQDFGECRTPLDPKWECHNSPVILENNKSPEFQLGTIKSAFEDARSLRRGGSWV